MTGISAPGISVNLLSYMLQMLRWISVYLIFKINPKWKIHRDLRQDKTRTSEKNNSFLKVSNGQGLKGRYVLLTFTFIPFFHSMSSMQGNALSFIKQHLRDRINFKEIWYAVSCNISIWQVITLSQDISVILDTISALTKKDVVHSAQ